MSRITGSEARGMIEAYAAVYAPQELTEEQIWEEVENWVNSLLEEGYDLSEYTWEEMYEAYITEVSVKPSAPTKPATGTLGKTSFERRTPTSAELKAAQAARAGGANPEQALQAAKAAGTASKVQSAGQTAGAKAFSSPTVGASAFKPATIAAASSSSPTTSGSVVPAAAKMSPTSAAKPPAATPAATPAAATPAAATPAAAKPAATPAAATPAAAKPAATPKPPMSAFAAGGGAAALRSAVGNSRPSPRSSSASIARRNIEAQGRENLYKAGGGDAAIAAGPRRNVRGGGTASTLTRSDIERRGAQAATLKQSYEYDAYDLVLEYLLNNGHVETVDEAHYVMLEMEAEVIRDIVEETRRTEYLQKKFNKENKRKSGSAHTAIPGKQNTGQALQKARESERHMSGDN